MKTRDCGLRQFRSAFEGFARQCGPAPRGTSRRVDAAGVPALWIPAPDGAGRTVLYLHGGGYVIGSADAYASLASHIARAAGAAALVPDYRLAPENVFPAAVDDAVQAYGWLLATGVAPSRVVVAGDSAGGGLTVATLLALRDGGWPLPAAAVCLSPWVDLKCSGESMVTRATADPVLSRDGLLRMAELYLAGAAPASPLASPLYADLHGLPPLLIQVGACESLYDDSTRLAAVARGAGVEVILDELPGAPHVYQLFSSFVPESRAAVDRIGAFVRTHTPELGRDQKARV